MQSKDEIFSNKVLLLVSSLTSDKIQEKDQTRARALLNAKGMLFEEVDGADPATHDLRNALCSLSGKKGCYPQFFIERSDGNRRFVGCWNEVEAMNECTELPPEILKANPQILTFDQVFYHVTRTKRPGGIAGGRPPAVASS